MHLDFSPAEEAWRSEVVEFLEAEIPADYRGETAYEDDEAYEFTRQIFTLTGKRDHVSLTMSIRAALNGVSYLHQLDGDPNGRAFPRL